jgi:hypothetical protein
MTTFIVVLNYTSSGNRCRPGLRLWELTFQNLFAIQKSLFSSFYLFGSDVQHETFFLLEKENSQKKAKLLYFLETAHSFSYMLVLGIIYVVHDDYSLTTVSSP